MTTCDTFTFASRTQEIARYSAEEFEEFIASCQRKIDAWPNGQQKEIKDAFRAYDANFSNNIDENEVVMALAAVVGDTVAVNKHIADVWFKKNILHRPNPKISNDRLEDPDDTYVMELAEFSRLMLVVKELRAGDIEEPVLDVIHPISFGRDRRW